MDEQVVSDQAVAGQRRRWHGLDQVQHRVFTDCQALAIQFLRRYAALQPPGRAFEQQRERQRSRSDQPQHDPARLDPTQQRTGKHGREVMGWGYIAQG